jgi:hypothetical protein
MSMGGTGGPQRTVHDGKQYLSVLGVAQALGRSTRTITRLEKKGILRPVRDLTGCPGERWYLADDVIALGRIAETSGFKQSGTREAMQAFAAAVGDWRRQQAESKPKSRWRDIQPDEPVNKSPYRQESLAQFQTDHDEAGPRGRRWDRVRNLLQYQQEPEWDPDGEAAFNGSGGGEIAVRVCPLCEKPLSDVTDPYGRLVATCGQHGLVQRPLMVLQPGRGPVVFAVSPEASTGRPGSVQAIGAVRAQRPPSRPRIDIMLPLS